MGAGLAGLAAAAELTRRGLQVVVLEARGRVGGRVASREIAGARFDVGGQWIGPTQHRMHRLVSAHGLDLFPQWHAGTKILDCQGKMSRYEGDIPSLPLVHLLELQRSLWRLDALTKRARTTPDPAWDRSTLADWSASHVRSARVRGLLTAAVRVIFGMEPAELSLLRFLGYSASADGFLSLAEIVGGAQQDKVVQGTHALAEAMAAGLEVHCGAAVRAIDQSGDSVHLHTDAGVWQAERVIVALPPHLTGRIAWTPALPQLREQLVQRWPMGATVKVFAVYERPFWREAGLSGEVVHTGGPLTVTFDATTAEGVPALLSFVVGDAARRWGERDEAERRRAVLESLVRWFGPEAGRPIGFGEEDWAREPWSGGCPTSSPVTGSLACMPALREPVGRVHWAGTETARRWTGFMEGAVESGERAAAEVAARFGGPTRPSVSSAIGSA